MAYEDLQRYVATLPLAPEQSQELLSLVACLRRHYLLSFHTWLTMALEATPDALPASLFRLREELERRVHGAPTP